MGIEDLLRTACAQDTEGQNDGQLLGRFLSRRDEAAFAVLLKRHGPMVLAVCRRILNNTADAEDAFQATFIVLVRRAASLTARAVLGDWLHGVARRTALNARRIAARRRAKEAAMARPEVQEEKVPNDRLAWLDEELARLPEKYRLPIVLCELEGRTRQEAAQRLQWPEGTVAGRLARGRELLAKRLVRHGLALSAGALPAADVPAALASSTIRAATLVAAGQAATGAIAASVAALAEGVVRNMVLTKVKMAAAVLLGAAVLAGGTTGLVVYRTQAEEPRAARQASEPKKDNKTPPESPERKAPPKTAPVTKPAAPAAPEANERIQPGDRLVINVMPTLPTFPIQGEFLVDASGMVRLGVRYGSALIKGLTLQEAEAAIGKHLGALINNPVVSVGWAELPNREDRIRPGDLLNIQVSGVPINGVFRVEPGGKVALGPLYGRVDIKGLTLEEAEKAIRRCLTDDPKSLAVQVTRPLAGSADADLEHRVRQLEKEVRTLRSLVEELQKKARP
jgi:RNA polymerase sigma factor (sigma-70 family)